MPALQKISRRGWWLIGRWTFFGTAGCLLIAIAFTFVSFHDVDEDIFVRALLQATILPIILAGPLFFYLTMKLRELSIANHKLAALAATDSLTGCLTRGAFVTRIEEWLGGTGGRRADPVGAFLIVDADAFKAINDTFGHVHGDDALLLIVQSLRGVLRTGDFVGRLGGEEFGVFLPGAAARSAADVAERIRHTVANAPFTPGGAAHPLTVSIGCVAFGAPVAFRDLFKIADARLYTAKNGGRNRVCAGEDAAPEPAVAVRRTAI